MLTILAQKKHEKRNGCRWRKSRFQWCKMNLLKVMQSYKRIERRCLPDKVGSKEDFFFNETCEMSSSVHDTHPHTFNKQ